MSRWCRWNDVSWLKNASSARELLQSIRQLADLSLEVPSLADFCSRGLALIMSELSAQWASLLTLTPSVDVVAESGRKPFRLPEASHLRDVLDRDAALFLPPTEAGGWATILVPLIQQPGQTQEPLLLAICGRSLTEGQLEDSLSLAQAFTYALSVVKDREQSRITQSMTEELLRISLKLSEYTDTESLLNQLAREATQLMKADRASIFVWDPKRHELDASPALGVDSGKLKLPDDKGIVGEVIQTGQSILVDDVTIDKRFDRSVDLKTGYRTRNILCVPLRNQSGKIIGAFELINKLEGAFTLADDMLLQRLGTYASYALERAQQFESLNKNVRRLTRQMSGQAQLIGQSPAIESLRATIERLATTDLPVLVLGESGTGKEVVSQSLHYQGGRAEKPFVAVNCAALSETLLESELFGHEKGAFTDAHEARAGKFEQADGGTLFLDEIGDMSLSGQAKLLRVLEQKVVTRVGGSKSIPVDVRVIAATNADLVHAVTDKRFRQDLYYRLSVVTISLPALRDRPEDVILLAEHFLQIFCTQARKAPLKLTASARKKMQAHHWPGNIRELRNLMERVAFLTPSPEVTEDDLAFMLSPETTSSAAANLEIGLMPATEEFQRDFIRKAIKRVQGNMSEAARLIGLHRSNLYRKMRQLEMHEAGGEE
ncbi:sigma-54 interaction domain-containing protein [Lacunimicrobium album]